MKTTIITVTFNAREALRETLNNVATFRAQYDDYIVIDGGSVDGTPGVLEQYACAGVITKWISEPDSGIYDAMNKGWSLATEDSRILYLGAGDKMLELPDTAIGSDAIVLYGDVDLEGRGVFHACADGRLKLGNTLHHQAMLVPKVLHPKPPFDCRFNTYADFDFNQRLHRRGIPFVRCDQLRGYAAAGGISHSLNVAEMMAVCRKNHGQVLAGLSYFYLKLQVFKSSLRKTP